MGLFAYQNYRKSEKHIAGLQKDLEELEKKSYELEGQLEALVNLTKAFREAEDENRFIEKVLNACVGLTGADFASLVPLDEHGQPITIFRYGRFSEQIEEAWIEYLASSDVRRRCGVCSNHGALMYTCPLIEKGDFLYRELNKPTGIFCLPLRRGEREYGLLNLYFTQDPRLSKSQKENLEALLDASALVLEYFRLHNKETNDRVALKTSQLETRFENMLAEMLEIFKNMTEADFILLKLKEDSLIEASKTITVGDLPASYQGELDEILTRVTITNQPYFSESASQKRHSNPSLSVVAIPLNNLISEGTGVLLVASLQTNLPENIRLFLKIMAAQINILVEALESVGDIEINAIMQERIRLAREIHDGLAQTLAYLKLQMLQMQTMVKTGETDRLKESLSQSYRVVSEAYLDVRQAIDDLRLKSEGQRFSELMKEILEEFEGTSGIGVNFRKSLDEIELPKEIQSQVIRIIQEALSNIRKHAHASQVNVEWKSCGERLQIEIGDDGIGFCLEDIPNTSRYGLRGMQERAALIGAELVISSKINAGTIIKLNLPSTLGNQN